MSVNLRLPSGGRIDRRRPLEFSFDGEYYQGYAGDTLASALLANGVRLVGRSFKYHRPRGIVGSGAEEPNALVRVGSGARATPNLRATQVDLYEGLEAFSLNRWPSLAFDVRALNGLLAGLLPAGFYYKTFMRPAWMWKHYEHHIRKAAGWGEVPVEPDRDVYERMNAHCDVLVVGGGPAGLAAALAAGRSGCRVILADEQNEFGGNLLANSAAIDHGSAGDWVTRALRDLAALSDVKLLPRTTVFGYYDHQFLTLLERHADHLPPALGQSPRQRLWRVRAKRVILATGATERPLVFGNNDRPGVMLASAVSTYLQRYAVKTGSRAVVFTNNDSAYRTALDLLAAGVAVAAVVDVRANPQGPLAREARAKGIDVLGAHAVVDVQGGKTVEGARIMALSPSGGSAQGLIRGVGCDLIAMSGGWNPNVHLFAQSGGKLLWNEAKACFIPVQPAQPQRSVGACAGSFQLGECLAEGAKAGAEAALALGFAGGQASIPRAAEETEEPLRPCWLVPSWKPHGPKQFVDFQNDTSAADVQLAAREGYRSVEHVKRYTALGLGTDQGKLGNINGMAILAQALGQDIPATGTTTFRPPYTPVTFGVGAGRDVGVLSDPLRKTALHAWHEEYGARFEDVGQWQRPWYYPQSGESMHDAVNRECRAVRTHIGVLDASTLGKIDIQGPDAATFLNWVYTNRWDNLKIGSCRYGLMLGEDGMVLDDGVTTRLAEHHYLMTTTTGGAARVLAWLERWLQTEWPTMRVYLTSVTDHWATLAVAGPESRKVLGKLCTDIDFARAAFPFMTFREGTVAGVSARVMRISFSGELGYEINVPANAGRSVWEALMAAGAEFGITPYGTEAMHVLRAEKGYIIVGQETDGSVTPVDLGLDGMLGNKEFLGKRSLKRADCVREDRKQLVGLLTLDPEQVLPEGGQIVEQPEVRVTPVPMIGHVTSSYHSATLQRSIALALVKGGRGRMGEVVYVPLANGAVAGAHIVKPLFYDPEGARLHG
ncbi:MAG: sarcosine oxidase subunit alpha family protein [Gammaproteobacteria bacterium]